MCNSASCLIIRIWIYKDLCSLVTKPFDYPICHCLFQDRQRSPGEWLERERDKSFKGLRPESASRFGSLVSALPGFPAPAVAGAVTKTDNWC